ncbi:MAG TPA: type III pantothenate kinase [Smithellaceae bacterium]|jgi:type III pantothenate kinase|nr:type III pantothenate kinase [Syntrophaceae bacterium]MDX9815522.1 type III pantothenate kinase [Smithellaceae bacterium]NMD06019.1 type III pantothenate kinase [Deltaproteobacteria bacterium]MBP8609684.1 type III pantothenate kinase [Syntrophaceae bacterium]HNQ19063.1 type III pantothenate kinase [Smithellaceae bacterium]
MLLVIDVGNTNTVLGLYDDDKLIHDWRIRTEIDHTVDEYGMLIFNLYQSSRIRTEQLKEIKDIIISCVVPPMLNILEPVCIKYFNVKPIIIGPGIRTGMPIYYDNPKEVGADRIVNAVAAYHKYHRAAIIIDFGTATTFDYISPKGEYMGGCIAPGILISIEALFQRAAKLPRVEFSKPKTVITKDTVSAMQAGIIFGYAGLIDGIVQRMKNEAKTDPMVIATGGLAAIVATETKSIERVEEMLTLEGLRIIYHMNKK